MCIINLNSSISVSNSCTFLFNEVSKEIYNSDHWGLYLNSDSKKKKEYQREESGKTMVINVWNCEIEHSSNTYLKGA